MVKTRGRPVRIHAGALRALPSARSHCGARLLRLLGISLVLVAAACRHGTAVPLFGTLRAHLEAERFDTVTSIGGLPAGVQDELRRLFGSASLDIAEAGAELAHPGDAAPAKAPSRRMIAAGCSTDHCLVYYERRGAAPAWRIALFRWAPDATRFEWGGAAPAGLASIADVRNAVLAGEIRSPNRSW